MRVLLLPSSYPPVLGGVQTAVHSLALDLLQRGHQVQVVTNRYPRCLPAHSIIDGVPVTRTLFINPQRDYLRRGRPDLMLAALYHHPATLRRMAALLAGFRPDVVHVHFPDCQIPFVLQLRRLFGFRLLVTLHGHDVERWTPELPDPRMDALRRITAAADMVTACSQYLLDYAASLGLIAEGRGVAVYNGVAAARFNTGPSFRRERPYIVALARLSYEKGFDLLLEAFARITAAAPDIDLLIVGSGPEEQRLRQQAARLGLGGRIAFHGRAESGEVAALMRGSELVAISSRAESFGIVALEAMAAGKPVLATAVGGLPEVLGGAPNLLVEPTVDGLHAGLREWLARRNRAAAWADHNRARAAQFTTASSTDHYLAIYENIIRSNHDRHRLFPAEAAH